MWLRTTSETTLDIPRASLEPAIGTSVCPTFRSGARWPRLVPHPPLALQFFESSCHLWLLLHTISDVIGTEYRLTMPTATSVLQESLERHNEVFESLLKLIPAKYYLVQDDAEAQVRRYYARGIISDSTIDYDCFTSSMPPSIKRTARSRKPPNKPSRRPPRRPRKTRYIPLLYRLRQGGRCMTFVTARPSEQ